MVVWNDFKNAPKFGEFKSLIESKDEIAKLKIVNDNDIEKIFYSDYYDDEPIRGLCIYEGEKLWFKSIFRDNNYKQTFALIRLSNKQLDEVLMCNCLFEMFVGNHFRYGFAGAYKFNKLSYVFNAIYPRAKLPPIISYNNIVVALYQNISLK